jgi:signal transduction histidine kinase/sensor domain CHASE-containing protein
MRISLRMAALGLLSFLMMISGVYFLSYNDRRAIDEMYAQRVMEKDTYFSELFRLKSDTMRKVVEDYTTWDDMTRFVTTKDSKWAHDNIDSILSTYNVDAYWVFDRHGALVYSVVRNADGVATMQPFPGELPLLDGRIMAPMQFYVKVAAGLMEIYGASIHTLADASRKGVPYGYFMAGRTMSSDYVAELEHNLRGKIALLDPGSSTHSASSKGEAVFIRELKDVSGQTLMVLKAHMALPEIQKLHEDNTLHMIVGLVFVLLFLITSMKIYFDQQAIRHAKMNLDEAQRLAGVGSWERDLHTGRGFWSDNYFRMLGIKPRKDSPGMDEFLAMIHQDDRDAVQAAVSNAITSTTADNVTGIEFRLVHDPEERIFHSQGKILMNASGKPVKIAGYIQDVTEKRRQEQERELLMQQKEAFIARLGHDLKTPLTPLVALLPLVRKYATDERQAKLIDVCLDNTNHMKELVVKTIKRARVSTQNNQGERNLIYLAAMVDGYIDKRADLLSNMQIVINNRILPHLTVMADELDLEEVFYNLISNAVKFSHPGSSVEIEALQEEDQVMVSIMDKGIGVASEDLGHLFDEFFKVDQSRHELDSSGLGLSICKRIVESHGGKIWAESAGREQGTTIRFTLKAGGSR